MFMKLLKLVVERKIFVGLMTVLQENRKMSLKT